MSTIAGKSGNLVRWKGKICKKGQEPLY